MAISSAPKLRIEMGVNRTRSWGMLAICAVLIAPLFFVEVPPLLDYPNHLARLYAEEYLDKNATLAQFFAARWGIIPDLGIDIIAIPLISAFPVFLAGRVLIAISMLAVFLGAEVYSRAILSDKKTYWSLGAGFVVINQTMLLGFLNFNLALGLSLCLGAYWVRYRDIRPASTILTAGLGVILLFFCHISGVLFFGLLIAGYEITRGLANLKHSAILVASRDILGRGAALCLVFSGALLLYYLSEFHGDGGAIQYPELTAKVVNLVYGPFVNYERKIDFLTVISIYCFILYGIIFNKIKIPYQSAISMLLVVCCYVVFPSSMKGVAYVDTRFAILFGVLMFSGVDFENVPLSVRRAVFGYFSVLFLSRMAIVCLAWASHAETLAALRTIEALVQPGQTVLSATISRPEGSSAPPPASRLSNGTGTATHMPALLLIDRQAWWPAMFSKTAQQPIIIKEPYGRLARRTGLVRLAGELQASNAVNLCGFDRVLLLRDGASTDPATFNSYRLHLVQANQVAALYDVTDAVDCRAAP